MPIYGIPQSGSFPNAANNLTTVQPGDTFVLFSAESPTPPQASVAFCRGQAPGTGVASPIVFQATWATTPTAQMDVQGSNTDVDAAYLSLGSITTQDGFYSDAGGFRFYRGRLVSQSGGGAVTLIAKG